MKSTLKSKNPLPYKQEVRGSIPRPPTTSQQDTGASLTSKVDRAPESGETDADSGRYLAGTKRKEYLRAYQRSWLSKRRNEWIAANGPCKFCGSWEKPEVDHIDPAQKIAHNVWSWTKERREAELAKCRILCRSCHHFRHKGRSAHGTVGRYKRHGCLCDLCRAANARRARLTRQRRDERIIAAFSYSGEPEPGSIRDIVRKRLDALDAERGRLNFPERAA